MAQPRFDHLKKLKYVSSFLRRKIIHTNLQLLYQCNFKCRICDFWKPAYDNAPRLSADDVRIISDKLAQVGPQIVSIGGGEPLMHPEIYEVISHLATHHFPVMICNGWFVTPEIAKELWKRGMYEISVSVDYADPSKHDKQRNKEGAYDHALKALKWLSDNRTNTTQRVHMISVIMKDNLYEVEPLIKICKDLGITYLVTLYSDSRGTKKCRSANLEVSQHLLKMKEKYPEFVVLRGYIDQFAMAVEENGVSPCYAGKNLINIDSQGNVGMCIDRLDSVVGNILQDDMSVIEQKLLDAHKQNECGNCWTSCRGSIETLMYGKDLWGNVKDYYQMTKPYGNIRV